MYTHGKIMPIGISEKEEPLFKKREITKNGKKRIILDKETATSTTIEAVDYISNRLKQVNRLNFANRNTIMDNFFQKLLMFYNLEKFSIIRIDIENFFDNINAKTVKSVIKEQPGLSRAEREYITTFFKRNEIHTGISLINVISELLGERVDSEIKRTFKDKEILYYNRYVDDIILVCKNDNIDKNYIISKINEILKTNIGEGAVVNDKYEQITQGTKENTLDYLGYSFKCIGSGNKSHVVIGISPKKLDVIKKKLKRVIQLFCEGQDSEDALLIKLDIFFKRYVFFAPSKSNQNKPVWQSRGFLSHYKLIQKFVVSDDTKYVILDESVASLLNGEDIRNIFREFGIDIPNKLKRAISFNRYKFSCKKNKAFIANRMIGLPYGSIYGVADKLGLNVSTFMSYDEISKSIYMSIYGEEE
ncbi:hypothetical protein ACPBEH_10975 [Latilactobacillus sp. 5-91]|uniref:hypothetical protein n=1 Tax=Latilactobacillus sp. 5-91 TaxID=3410924 RepID=UPI003C70FDB5